MHMSDLSAETGVSIATLKYYLREGLLQPGESLSATRARYDDTHLERVRLIRALIDSGGLSVAAVKRVIAAIESPPPSRHELLGAAHQALPTPYANREVSNEVHELVAALEWQIDGDAPALHSLTGAIEAARSAGVPLRRRTLTTYAKACQRIAAADVQAVRDRTSPGEAVATVIVGTVMVDPVLAALRRLAQEDQSARQQ